MSYKYQSDAHQARIQDFSGIFSRPGEYQDEKGALQCKMCPPGTTTMILGMKSISGQVWAMISVDFLMSLSSSHRVFAAQSFSDFTEVPSGFRLRFLNLSRIQPNKSDLSCSESGHYGTSWDRFAFLSRVVGFPVVDPRSARSPKISQHLKPNIAKAWS